MIKNNVYYEFFASYTVPNPDEVGYWVDLGANSKGKIIKVYNPNTRQWVKVTDATSEDAVAPFIGSNGNWWVDNRDTGIPAAGKNPYIGDNGNWFVYDPIASKYVDTKIVAKGKSAYDLALEHGYQGTEEEWIESLKKPALDAAATALDAANKANAATENVNAALDKVDAAANAATDAADRANTIANNPPKIINNEWWIYNEEQAAYVNTGISAIGDAFTYKKEYPSIEAMEADWDNPEVEIGQYVIISVNDPQDPDDAKVYLKTTTGWKFIVDLSGMQGIQGWSAYEIAVQHGFKGTEEEWVQSLKQPALDAAQEALNAKDQVLVTETNIKAAEELRVTAEQGRVTAESTRVTNENARIAAETIRSTSESERVTTEASRVEAEKSRVSNEAGRTKNEDDRVANELLRQSDEATRDTKEAERESNEAVRKSSESTRVAQETARVNAETARVNSEDARKDAETARDTAESTRVSQEATRQANEAIRETQETERQTNTTAAINAVNEAKTAASAAATNATTAASNANTQAARAKEYADNPPKIETNYWYVWDDATDKYVNTNVNATGDPGKSPMIQEGTWWVYNNETDQYENTGVSVNSQYELTKDKVEAVLTGDITSHNHDSMYYTKEEVDAKAGKSFILDFEILDPDVTYKFPVGTYQNLLNALNEGVEILINEPQGNANPNYEKPSRAFVNTDTNNIILGLDEAIIDETFNFTNIHNIYVEIRQDDSYNVDVAQSVAMGVSNTFPFDPTEDYNPATKKYVDDTVAAKEIAVDSALSDTSINPVQNKVVKTAIDTKANSSDVTIQLNTKVDKVEGKGLSTNDYDNESKRKVGTIPQTMVTDIQSSTHPNWFNLLKYTTSDSKTITIHSATEDMAGVMSAADKTKLDSLPTVDEIDNAINTALGSVYKVKGSVASVSNLPTTNVTVGDVYNVNDTGANYVAIDVSTTPITWDKLSETVDLSAYSTTAQNDSKYLGINSPRIVNGDLAFNGSAVNGLTNKPYLFGDAQETRIGAANTETTSRTSYYLAIGSAGSAYIGHRTNNLTDSKWDLWHTNNDGAGSGLDADLLDGKQGSEYLLATTADGKFLSLSGGTLTGRLGIGSYATINSYIDSTDNLSKLSIGSNNSNFGGILFNLGKSFSLRTMSSATGSPTYGTVWSSANDGARSGLDADLLDGKQGNEYALKTEAITEAPSDGKTYGRKNKQWSEIIASNQYLDLTTLFPNESGTLSDEDYQKIVDAWENRVSLARVGDVYFSVNITKNEDSYGLSINMSGLNSFELKANLVVSVMMVSVYMNDKTYVIATNYINLVNNGTGTKYLSDNGEYLTPPTATSATAGYMSADDKNRVDDIVNFGTGSNTVTTLVNIPTNKRLVKATLSSASNLSINESARALNVGEEIYLDCNPTASFTQPIPTAGSFRSMSGSSITTTSGVPFEMSILKIATSGVMYSITVKEKD